MLICKAYGTVIVNETAGNLTIFYNLLYIETTFVGDDLFVGYLLGPPTLDPLGPFPIQVSTFRDFKFFSSIAI